MAIIPQLELFSWEEIEPLGDLERLRLVLEHLPDEALMAQLEKSRGHGRDDYPVRAMWNSVLAGIVFQHPTIESLRRELSRNGQLRSMCGLHAVPSAAAYTRFLRSLMTHGSWIETMFDELVKALSEELPEFGRRLAMDSKAIASWASRPSKEKKEDGRRDLDAEYGAKTYRGTRQDGTIWENVVRWFGYKLHLVVDAQYELPVAYTVTKGSRSDVKEGHVLLDELEKRHPEMLKKAEVLTADRGYDDSKLLSRCWDEYGIKPVIDTRRLWKDGEKTRLLPGHTNVVYDEGGAVYCYCPETGTRQQMSNGGFEKDRGTLKKVCPAKAYGVTCKGRERCPVAGGVRVALTVDRRIFTPIARESYKWAKEYRCRTAVERVNSRLDVSFGLEQHTIRGLAKMRLRCGLALCVMLAMALGKVREKQQEHMRSLVRRVS
ncbi:MAG TPA: transposase [Alicyclobacillus sp.]|nr:transposase [Alicyclobacillus sp.]